MKESNNIDNLFKNSLKNFREEPPEIIKENIDFELAKSNEDKKGFFYKWKFFILFSLLTICAIGAIGIYSLNNNNPSEKLLSDNNANNLVQKNNSNLISQNQKNTKKENNLESSNDLKNPQEQNTKKIEITKNKEIKNSFQPENNQNNKEISAKNFNKISNTNSNNSKLGNNSIPNNEINESKTTVNTKDKISVTLENSFKTVVENNFKEISNNQIQEKKNTSVETSIENTTEKGIQNNTVIENKTNQNIENKNSEPLNNSDSLKINENKNTENIITNSSIDQPIIKNKCKILKNFSADFFAAPVYINKTISASTVNSDYLKLRKENEKPLLTYNLGLELKYSIKNFFLQTGINYSNFGEKINYNTIALSSIDTSGSFWDLHSFAMVYVDTINWDSTNGYAIMTTSVPLMDSIWQHKSDSIFSTLNTKNSNQLTYVEVPLLLGYTLGKGKINCQISTGISYAFLIGSKGKLLRTDASGFNDILVETPYRKNMYNFLLRIGCSYHLNEKISVVLQPSFKLNLNSIFESAYPASQKYHSYGLNIGLNYKF